MYLYCFVLTLLSNASFISMFICMFTFMCLFLSCSLCLPSLSICLLCLSSLFGARAEKRPKSRGRECTTHGKGIIGHGYETDEQEDVKKNCSLAENTAREKEDSKPHAYSSELRSAKGILAAVSEGRANLSTVTSKFDSHGAFKRRSCASGLLFKYVRQSEYEEVPHQAPLAELGFHVGEE